MTTKNRYENADDYEYNPISETLVSILKQRTQSNNTHFFRILASYYLTKIASTMRTNICTDDRGKIPVNMYAINLAPSGVGKGYSTNILEESVMNPFKKIFLDETYQITAENSLKKLAHDKAVKTGEDEDVEFEILMGEFNSLGHMLFSFDSGTTPAVKQMRQKLLMAGSGALSMEIDEIGSNLISATDVLNTFLELYDVGKIKEKLIKNTSESKRLREIDGKTPANMMLFGTPNKLLDSSKTEEEYKVFLETGYSRRCIFGYSTKADHNEVEDEQELYDLLTTTDMQDELDKLTAHFQALADIDKFNINLTMGREAHLLILSYKINCNRRSNNLADHRELEKAEMEHRYYKALKLAGTYAFISESDELLPIHLEQSIKLVEDSGVAFKAMINGPKPYERLASFIADVGREVTQVDLIENLPFFKGSDANKRDMISLAITYGYKNNIIIKKSYIDNIEFYTGETLKETNLDELILSYSNDDTKGYKGTEIAPFDTLNDLLTANLYNFCSHQFCNDHRISSNAVPGFNILVLDIDGEASLETAQLLLKEYTYKMYTTKSHTAVEHRFRILLPLSHIVKLDTKEHSLFMENVFEWLPFGCDEGTKDNARKWACNEDALIYDNYAELLDATLFIPQTKKSDQIKAGISEHTNLNNLEKWFIREVREGNRSDMLLKYGLILKDARYPIDVIRAKIDSFNEKLEKPLEDNEISRSIMITIAKRMGT